jgi:hypothetical protein
MCFRYERKAGELSKKLKNWNHSGSLSKYVFKHIDNGDAVAMWFGERDAGGDCDVAEGQSWQGDSFVPTWVCSILKRMFRTHPSVYHQGKNKPTWLCVW